MRTTQLFSEKEFQLELLRSIQRLERKLEGLEGKLQDII